MDNIALEDSWKKLLLEEFSKPYMQELKKFLIEQKQAKKIIYPKSADLFNAFALTPVDQVKVVIVGQDPYHGSDQAHGLCFSVLPHVAVPPSLVNIYRELHNDLKIPPAKHGCLINWAKQGVLLLNSTLTVEAGKPGSHQRKGWEKFTDQVINILNAQDRQIIFLLWGTFAQHKCHAIDISRHAVLKAPHPSPIAACRGFFGCKHFSKTNILLHKAGKKPIDWRLGNITV